MADIPWDALPKTFQDAIEVTRRLGISYLWIDSLCIIQDSKDDWAREASKMADIYRNAYVTVAATGAKDSTVGLFLDSPRQPGVLLKGSSSEGKPYSIQFYAGADPGHSDEPSVVDRIIQHPTKDADRARRSDTFRLLTRGWVFQERLLSPRFLQFGQDELLWDCREATSCECGQRPPDLVDSQCSMDGTPELLAHKWRNIVELYSSLDLTFPTDALPALSGLAKRMAECRPGATYLAGIWDTSLALDLLWVPIGSARRRANPYRAPTWSWSSVMAKTAFPGKWRSEEAEPSVELLEAFFTLDNAYCTASTYDGTGQVSDGNLTIVTSLLQANLKQQKDGSLVEYEGTTFHTANEQDTGISHWGFPFYSKSKILLLDDPQEALSYSGAVFCCRISRIAIQENSNFFLVLQARETVEIEFSLVLECLERQKKVFRRVGLLADGRIIEGHQGDSDSWKREPSIFESRGPTTTITIV